VQKGFSYQQWFKPKAKTRKINIQRKAILFGFLVLLFLFALSRLVYLQLAHQKFLRHQGNLRMLHHVDIPSYRGVISDRRGSPLAVSTPVDSIWANPKLINIPEDKLNSLAQLLQLSPEKIQEKLIRYKHKGFIYLKRGLTPDVGEKIKDLQISGIGLKREYRRYYPTGKQTAQIVGFTNIDDEGQAGIELSFNEHLKPVFGKKRVLEDRYGHWIQDVDHIQMPKAGDNINLSIDLRLQAIALYELEQALEKYKAKSATVVMIDTQTTEIICMVSAPSFNPNSINERSGPYVRNRAVTDTFEPGSTFKALSLASALANGNIGEDSIIDTRPGVLYIGEHKVKDVSNNGQIKVKDILRRSSNIGITKLTLGTSSEDLVSTLRNLGFGASLYTDFPGERSGILPDAPLSPFIQATLAFGYGLSSTPLQLANSYATLANAGIRYPVSLIKREKIENLNGRRVLPENVANSVMKMLSEVTEKGGTGTRAKIPGYKTAGKTGTVRIVGPNGYDPNRHNAYFVGITPVKNPRLATVIIVEEPNEKKYYGGLVAAPLYKSIVSKAIHVLNIPPDNA
jgi:cell division protein FtsI (penicillin-binding protein 3)